MKLKKGQTYSIGITRTLYYFYYPGLWETFFRDLGMKIVVSKASTRKTVERAGLISEAEHCLPLKIFDAHLAEIVGKVDMVFVPRILSSLKGHISCPKLGALPDAAMADISRETRVLTIDINEDKVPLLTTLMSLGRKLGVNHSKTLAAARNAMEAMKVTREKMSPICRNENRRFLILGHPYNLYDEYISGPILRKLESLDVGIELVSFDVEELPISPIRWDTCSKMYHALQRLVPEECAGVIQISSFNCGCDSIVMEVFRGVLKDKGIPYMVLVLDEHSAQAGMDTRIEAFVDSTGW